MGMPGEQRYLRMDPLGRLVEEKWMISISPKEIYEYVDQYVVGQHEAKVAISNCMFMHYVKCMQSISQKKAIAKTNLLLMGPSGSGKTLLVMQAAEALREITQVELAPFLEIDCTSLAAVGWEGNHIMGLLECHKDDCGLSPFGFETSVIFLDEFDKMCIPAIGSSGTDHNRNTQYNLLKVVEGVVFARGTKKFDTSKMLFVFAGNFPQIRHRREKDSKPSMGFGGVDTQAAGMDVHTELEKGGVISQLVGRISQVAELHRLGKKELRDILVYQMIPEHAETWWFMGGELKVSDYHIRKIVAAAHKKGTGARGLQAGLDLYLSKELFKASFTHT